MKQGVLISTIEHLLSSLYIFGVDNAIIELDNLEVPILDGSALEFVSEIQRVGLKEQSAPRTYLVIRKELHLEERGKTISIYPAPSFQISYSIDFPHPMIGKQTYEFDASPETFARDIAPARTFGFLHEVEELKKNGLVRGGSMDNAIVLTKTGILNDILRFKDEFVRHKISGQYRRPFPHWPPLHRPHCCQQGWTCLAYAPCIANSEQSRQFRTPALRAP